MERQHKTARRQRRKKPHEKGLATHLDPESCADTREGAREALTGARTGRDIEPRNTSYGTPTPSSDAEGHAPRLEHARDEEVLRGQRPLARSETSLAGAGIPRAHRSDEMERSHREVARRTAVMHEHGESDGRVVPTKPWNKTAQAAADMVEGRGPAKRNSSEQNMPRTQCRTGMPSALARVHEAARVNSLERFRARLEVGAGCGKSARPDLRRGP